MTIDHFAHPIALQCHYYEPHPAAETTQVWHRLDFAQRPRCDRCQHWYGGQCRMYRPDAGPV